MSKIMSKKNMYFFILKYQLLKAPPIEGANTPIKMTLFTFGMVINLLIFLRMPIFDG